MAQSKKIWKRAALAIVALIVAVFLFWPHSTSSQSGKAPAPRPASTSASASAKPSDQAKPGTAEAGEEEVSVADKTVAGRILRLAPKNMEAVVGPKVKAEFNVDDFKQVIPEDSIIQVDEKTWTKIDDNTIMVKADVTKPGEKAVSYAVVMARENPQAQWKIVGTLDYDQGAMPLVG